jgi:hypothetical protein
MISRVIGRTCNWIGIVILIPALYLISSPLHPAPNDAHRGMLGMLSGIALLIPTAIFLIAGYFLSRPKPTEDVFESSMRVTREESGEWCLELWLTSGFDFDYPFRRVLSDLAVSLPGSAVLTFPPYRQDEDFIHGVLDWNGQQISTYFEYSLGVVKFSSNDKVLIERLQVATRELKL